MEEAELVANRSWLRALLRDHPDWPNHEYAAQIGRSVGWVKKWKKRLLEAAPTDEAVLWSQSRARKHPPPSTHPAAVERILDIRDHPPENLHRTPGPRAILYYLHRASDLHAQGIPLPRSTRTIWCILTQHDRILHAAPRERVPMERPDPLLFWQLDFKDVSTVPPDPDGKQQHVVEVLNTVDVGTSILLNAQVGEDFTAETVLPAVVETLRQNGRPQLVGFDRDPRFVGGMAGRDFPTPFVRFWHCLGVQVYICPPHRPDRNAFVERYHRSYDSECLKVHRPSETSQVKEVTEAYHLHYNTERPNQAITCGNRPPRMAFPTLPTLPALPAQVDPDSWLLAVHGRHYARKVKREGSVDLDGKRYYIKTALAGQHVSLEVDAATCELVVWHQQQVIKRLRIKGLINQPLAFEDFLAQLCREARTDWQRYCRLQRRRHQAGA